MIIGPIKRMIKKVVQRVKKEVYVKLIFEHHMNYTFEQSKSMLDIRKEVMKEIKERVDFFDFTIELSDIALFFVFSMIIFKSWNYRRLYLTRDRYDNGYITFTVRDIDVRSPKKPI